MNSSDDSSSKLFVNISGSPGSGKTTLALALQQFLKEKGFADVIVGDIDVDMGCSYPELQPARFEAITDRTVIISTFQTPRSRK